MKNITDLTFHGNKTFSNVKALLMKNGVKNFTNIRKNLATFDGVLVTITRFEFKWNNKLYFAVCEPETGIFEISTKPIGKFY